MTIRTLALLSFISIASTVASSRAGDEGGCVVPDGEYPTPPGYLCNPISACDDEHSCSIEFEECIVCTEQLTAYICLPSELAPGPCTDIVDGNGCGWEMVGICSWIEDELLCFEYFQPIPPRPCCRVTCGL
jgi:hypothetical protein